MKKVAKNGVMLSESKLFGIQVMQMDSGDKRCCCFFFFLGL